VALLAMLALLAVQLGVLLDSRKHIAAQDAKINRLTHGVAPALREAGPLARDARGLVRRSGPLVEQVRTGLVPLLQQLGDGELAAVVDETAQLAREMNAGHRLVRLVDSGDALLRAVSEGDYLGRTLRAADLAPFIARILAETLRVQRATLAVQRRTLVIQRRSARIQSRTLAIQREALVHIRSIDRKTGGSLPVP
jgi:hypothetical protein